MTTMLHIREAGSGRCIAYMLPSNTEPGAYHITTARWCDCRGFTYRRRCRHTQAARAHIDAQREPQPADLVITGLMGMAAQRGESTIFD